MFSVRFTGTQLKCPELTGETHSASVELITYAGVLPSGPQWQKVSLLLLMSKFQSKGRYYSPLSVTLVPPLIGP